MPRIASTLVICMLAGIAFVATVSGTEGGTVPNAAPVAAAAAHNVAAGHVSPSPSPSPSPSLSHAVGGGAASAHISAELQERRRKQEEARLAFAKEHAGHEKMHAEMVLVLFITLILAQILLVWWKTTYFASYQTVTLVGVWIFPVCFSVYHAFARFVVIWLVFTVATCYVVWRATRRPLPPRTPRLVYTFFLAVSKLTGALSVGGYLVALLDFMIGPYLPRPANQTLMSLGLLTIYYGLYFGVLSRDFADICARRMASSIGYYAEGGIPPKQLREKQCAICGKDTAEAEAEGEKTIKLACGHSFHEFCVRGWCIVGKRDTCPYCREKVDLKAMFPSVLQRTDVMYAQLLDALRYLVMWYPVIMSVVKLINWGLGLH